MDGRKFPVLDFVHLPAFHCDVSAWGRWRIIFTIDTLTSFGDFLCSE